MFSQPLNAQLNNNWAFGHGLGLNFSNDSAKYFSSNSKTHFASASISDSSGRLLLYFDKFNVYNKDHEIIEGGDTLLVSHGASGRVGSSRSFFLKSQIYPNKYFLIVSGVRANSLFNKTFNSGLFVYPIDIKANNGKGKVENRVDSLFYGSPFSSITATMHQNQKDVWIVGRMGKRPHRNGNLYDVYDSLVVFSFSNDKLSLVNTYFIPLRENIRSAWDFGSLTFSNSGGQISESYNDVGSYNPNYGADSAKTFVALMDFDNANGIITNRRMLHYYADKRKKYPGDLDSDLNQQKIRYYGKPAFSPNDSFIYCVTYRDNDVEAYLIQFPTYSSNPFIESQTYRFNSGDPSALELGPDKRLYISYADYDFATRRRIATLDCPNKKFPSCGINLKAFYLPDSLPWSNQYAFPIKVYKDRKTKFSYNAGNCSKIGILRNLSDSVFKKFTWYWDNNTSSITNNHKDFTLPYQSSGKYLVKLKGETGAGWVSWHQETVDYIAPPKAEFSYNTNTGCRYIAFDFENKSKTDTIKSTGGFAHWFFGDNRDTILYGTSVSELLQNVSHTYTKSGIYTVQLIFSNGFCTDTFELKNSVLIKDASKPGIAVSNTKGCQPLEIDIKRLYNDSIISITYDFGDGSTLQKPTVINANDAPTKHTYTKPGAYTLIQAIQGLTGCITSDSIEIKVLDGFDGITQPNLLYATVVNDTASIIEWKTFDKALFYQVFKSENKTTWKNIAALVPNTSTFIDKNIKPKEQRYWYKIVAVDTCDKTVESNTASTILLKGKRFENEYSIIEWQPYENWKGGILGYQIEVLDNTQQWKIISTIGQTNYQDFTFSDEEGVEKCYRITAIENGGEQAISISNSLCLPFSPVIWIPNGFTPNNDGLNDVYTISTLGIKELKITLYNTYGEEVYSCEGINCKWNGEYKNNPAPEGTYNYILSAKTVENKNINRWGTITLMR